MNYFQGNLDNNSNSKTVVLEPSPTRAVFKKVTLALVFAALFVKFLPIYPIKGVKDENFRENTSLLYKFWYLYLATMFVRFKYYFAWLLADATCNNSGIGYSGLNADGSPNWNYYSNINILKFEVSFSDDETKFATNYTVKHQKYFLVYFRLP